MVPSYRSVPRQLPVTWFMLVPTSVAPTWWQAGLVICAVAAFGVLIGWRASRAVVASPFSVTRRQLQSPPRPWGLVLIVGALILAFLSLNPDTGVTAALASVAAAGVGIMSLAPWLGYRLASYVEARTGSAARLLAARRIMAEPRAVGRAAAAVGAIALVSGGVGGIFAELLRTGNQEAFYLVSLLIVAVMVLAGLLIVTATMAVHAVESLLERKRETAGLVAMGPDVHELMLAQRYEGALVAMPMAALGVLLGSTALIVMQIAAAGRDTGFLATSLLILVLNVLVTMALVWLAVKIAVQMVRTWILRATAAGNLRTE